MTWSEKVDLLILNPLLSVKQVQSLLDVGQPSALELREGTLKLAKEEGRWVGPRKIPADLLLKHVGMKMSYFEEMAARERRLSILVGSNETQINHGAN